MTERYRVCTRCVMDTSAVDISFNRDGACNYCSEALERLARASEGSAVRRANLAALVAEISASGKNKRYDCVVGVSGGIDSSWVLLQAVRLGLRPLAVHMDNGWNSELAQSNIANLVNGLGVDLETHVIDWEEYRQLMRAFLDADVIDIELLYDNALLAVNYRTAAKYGLRHIVGGTNYATEGMRIPSDWNWFKYDKTHIRALARRFGAVRLKTFPAIGTLNYLWFGFVKHIRWISMLNLMDYNKAYATNELTRLYGYKPYPYKHYESIFTRFYQGYILPKKFGVDKRRVHFGSLIASGQLSREDAMRDLESMPYPSEKALDEDRRYFLKKIGWNESQFVAYLARPQQPHGIYGSERSLWQALAKLYRLASNHP